MALIQPREREAWALPKGFIELGETPEKAAMRETREETGLSGNIEVKLDTIKYSYTAKWENPPARILKIVTFFLMQFTEGDPNNHDHEVDRVEWFALDTAIKQATYAQEKEVLKKAKRAISRQEQHNEA